MTIIGLIKEHIHFIDYIGRDTAQHGLIGEMRHEISRWLTMPMSQAYAYKDLYGNAKL